MKRKINLRIGISVGDINGIGPEVVLKALSDTRILELCTPVIFASNKLISFMKKQLDIEFNFNGITTLNNIIDGKMNVMNCWREMPQIEFGQETSLAGKCAFESLEHAVNALKNEAIDAIVTAPINKKNIQSEVFHFPGHTDYLAKELAGDSLMFLISDELRVGLLTDHVPIKDITSHITQELIFKKVNLINESLIKDFRIIRPRIAVLGLNPHCGDQGVIGQEDDLIIRPAIEKLYQEGILIFGPYSADSFFVSQYQDFDAIITPYHDQGLIPFKTLSFGKGVNFTAGLNKIRTSPDHGTAYSIAGKGIADESSFREAIYKAIDIYHNREEYKELTSNTLVLNNLPVEK